MSSTMDVGKRDGWTTKEVIDKVRGKEVLDKVRDEAVSRPYAATTGARHPELQRKIDMGLDWNTGSRNVASRSSRMWPILTSCSHIACGGGKHTKARGAKQAIHRQERQR
eukprot:3538213-Rhodomonas_salina.1